MWQRFSENAKKTIFYAQEEAGRLGWNTVTPDHLLLGLTRSDETVAAKLLKSLGVRPGSVSSAVERQCQSGPGRQGSDMQLAAKAKRILDLAKEESEKADSSYIGTEHFLIAIMREGESNGSKVLIKLGATEDRLRKELEQLGKDSKGSVTIPRQQPKPPRPRLDLSSSVVLAVKLAGEEAAKAKQSNVETEYLLLALLLQENETACKILNSLGVDIDAVRDKIRELSDESN